MQGESTASLPFGWQLSGLSPQFGTVEGDLLCNGGPIRVGRRVDWEAVDVRRLRILTSLSLWNRRGIGKNA